jgi:hypothetical protein
MTTVKKSRFNKKTYMQAYLREYNKKTKRIRCTLKLSQYQSLEQYAKEAGMKPATFLKKAAFAYINHRQLLPKSLTDSFPSLIAFIRNIANNINQIARHTNTFKRTTIYDLLKVRRNVLALETQFAKFSQKFFQNDCQINESEKKV